MPITVTCTQCGTQLKAPDNAAGRKVKCPKCTAIIAVPQVLEEAQGIQTNTPAPVAPPPPPARRPDRDHDDDRDRGRGSRRRSRDDDYDDYQDEDYPRSRRGVASTREGEQGTGLQLGMGVAGLVLGLVGGVFALIPLCGFVIAAPACGLGLTLGLIGLIVAIVKKEGYGFPIAGTAVSVAGLCLAIFWWIWFAAAANNAAVAINQGNKDIREQLDKINQNKNKGDKDDFKDFNPFKDMNKDKDKDAKGKTLPLGTQIILDKGLYQSNLELTLADPKNAYRLQHFKVFTLRMEQGRTYVIDMMSNQLDSYLILETMEGNNLAMDDDGGEGRNARIHYACTNTGTYRIIATTFLGGTGPFTLKVAEK